MNKVLSLAYFAGGSKFTIDPFIALKNSRHDLKVIFTKSLKRSGRGKKKAHNLLLDKSSILLTKAFDAKLIILPSNVA